MKLIAQVKLNTTPEQADALKRTLEAANAAANYISDYAWQNQTFRQFDLHRALYYELRERFALSAQVVVRVLAKVADAYKLDRRTRRTFKPLGSIAYDERILAWRLSDQTVSIWTVASRQRIPFLAGERQMVLLQSRQGEADLVYHDGTFYLHQTCNVEDPPTGITTDFLGVDLGIINIAADSDGNTYSGGKTNGLRKRHAKLRARLQAKRTKSVKRLLQKRRRKEARFARDVNHVIAKQLVAKAKDTGRGIALEDLKGIRERITVRKAQRRVQHSWAFHQLRSFVEYKALMAGVPVALVDPRNTSRTCPACGRVAKANRPTQALFRCVSCGFAGPADTIAAENIRRAAVNQPHAAGLLA